MNPVTWRQTVLRWDHDTGVVTAVAGAGGRGSSGDGGPATSAFLGGPRGVAVDGIGNVYVADEQNHRIRRVDHLTGTITTVAGTGGGLFAGDDGPATSAAIFYPNDVAVDGRGNMYIADYYNSRVRRVDGVTGIITTVATPQFPVAVAVDPAGNAYVTAEQRIRRIDVRTGAVSVVAGSGSGGYCGDNGPATQACLPGPIGVTVNAAGDLFIADASAHVVRRVDFASGVITRVAGTGVPGFAGDRGPALSAQLRGPVGVSLDGRGNIYVADAGNQRIRVVDGQTGVMSTVVGTGGQGVVGDLVTATNASLDPTGLALDGQGGLYVVDRGNNRVWRMDLSAGFITILAGTGRFGRDGDGAAAVDATLWYPVGVAVGRGGEVFIADSGNGVIRRVSLQDGVISRVAGTGGIPFSGDQGPATSANLQNPAAVTVDAVGNLFIADTGHHRIRFVDHQTGIINTVVGTGDQGYLGDEGPALAAQLSEPKGVVLDLHGNLYIADTGNSCIRRVSALDGVIRTVAGTGTAGYLGDEGPATSAQLNEPTGVAVDPEGYLTIADTKNHRVRRVDPLSGFIVTVAGTGVQTNTGDGGRANNAALNSPRGVALDDTGNLYVADSGVGSTRVRRVDASSGIITPVAGRTEPDRSGPVTFARLADPRGMVLTPGLTLFAGGSSGVVQGLWHNVGWLNSVVGRYPQYSATGNLARFRSSFFGAVAGVAWDGALERIYLTESNVVYVVTLVNPGDANTWTMEPMANTRGYAGFSDGAVAGAQFRRPTGLFFDEDARVLYVADTGNHGIRAILVDGGTVTTVAGTPATLGFFGDGMLATAALLNEPSSMTRCVNGDLFIADTGNHRVRRVEAGSRIISTVLGDGVAASSGQGRPSSTFPVDTPLGLGCDASGNVLVTSSSTVRLVLASGDGVVDGSGEVQSIFGEPPRTTFPASVTRCLTGVAVVDETHVQVTDSCTGMLVELSREDLP
jgi:sugar lactone lactonase YvrE